MKELEDFKCEQHGLEQGKSHRMELEGRATRLLYYCQKKRPGEPKCTYAFIAIIPSPEPSIGIQLYTKGTHFHPDKPNGPRDSSTTNIHLGEVHSLEEVQLRQKVLRLQSFHGKGDTNLRYRCGDSQCSLLLTAYPTGTGSYQLYTNNRDARHDESCTMPPVGERRKPRGEYL